MAKINRNCKEKIRKSTLLNVFIETSLEIEIQVTFDNNNLTKSSTYTLFVAD